MKRFIVFLFLVFCIDSLYSIDTYLDCPGCHEPTVLSRCWLNMDAWDVASETYGKYYHYYRCDTADCHYSLNYDYVYSIVIERPSCGALVCSRCNPSSCSFTSCGSCGLVYCSSHSSHSCSGTEGGGNSGGTEGGGSEGGNSGGTEGGGSEGGNSGGTEGGGSEGDNSEGPNLSPIITAIGSVKDSVEGTKDYIERLEGTVDALKDPIGRVENSVRFVDDTLNIIDNSIRNVGDRIGDKLTVTGTPASPSDFSFEKEQRKPTLDQEKINRSVLDQISKKLFPNNINRPSGTNDLFFTFTLSTNSICPFLPNYKVELSSQSFWSNSAIVAAASFCKTVTYFFFGWVTLLAFARALRQW